MHIPTGSCRVLYVCHSCGNWFQGWCLQDLPFDCAHNLDSSFQIRIESAYSQSALHEELLHGLRLCSLAYAHACTDQIHFHRFWSRLVFPAVHCQVAICCCTLADLCCTSKIGDDILLQYNDLALPTWEGPQQPTPTSILQSSQQGRQPAKTALPPAWRGRMQPGLSSPVPSCASYTWPPLCQVHSDYCHTLSCL